MTEHLTGAELQELRDGRMPPARLSGAMRHLHGCRECGAALQLAPISAAFMDDDDGIEHVDTELAAYLAGAVEPVRRKAIDEHLASCADCRAELDDLRAWAKPAAGRRRRPMRWIVAAAAAAAIGAIAYLIAPGLFVTIPQHPPDTRVTSTGPRIAPPPPIEDPGRRPEWQRLVDETLRSGKLPVDPSIRELGGLDRFRGTTTAGPGAAALWPAATAIVERRPEFRWPPSEPAQYTVVVESGTREVARSPRLDSPRWTIDADLVRGRTYRWQVLAGSGDDAKVIPAPPDPPALFRVIDERTHAEIERARRERPADDLLLGLLYARAGVLDAARTHLEAHARSGAAPRIDDLLDDLRP
jgi:hypothetical protein